MNYVYKLTYALFFLFTCHIECYAQTTAKSVGVGMSDVADYHLSNVFNNIAGIGQEQHISLQGGYHYRFYHKAFQTLFGGVIIPYSKVKGAITWEKFGTNLYSEQKFSAGITHNIHQVSIGIRGNYWQLSGESLATEKAYSLDIGTIIQLSKNIYLGANISNITQASLDENSPFNPYTALNLGLKYKPIATLNIMTAVLKRWNEKASLQIGIDYTLHQYISLRSGIQTTPSRQYFGCGLNLPKFHLDYALEKHPFLPLSHHISCSIPLKKL